MKKTIMQFSTETFEYLNGKKFIGSLPVTISQKSNRLQTRIGFLEEISTGKNIIHVGCVDHLPLIDKKIADNTWLHKRLSDKATRCLGVDIVFEGIDYIKKLGYNDSLCIDLATDQASPVITAAKWDYMILGEILEHVDNPVFFLSSIQKRYKGCVDKLIITVPNALRWINMKNAFARKEIINSDHRFWFTPYTLAKLCHVSGLKAEEFMFLLDYKMKKHSIITRTLYKWNPALLDNVCIIASL